MHTERNAPPRDTRPLAKTSVPGVYKRGGRYVVTYRKPSGKQGKKYVQTLGEARVVKSQLVADVARGEYRETSRARFDEYAADWIDTYTGRTSRGIRPETLAEYRRQIERRAIPFFGRTKLAAIEPRDVRRFVAGVTAEGVAPNTVRLAVAPLRALFTTAVEDGVLRVSPCAGLRLDTKRADEQEHRAKALTVEELTRLLDEIHDDHRLVATFLATTGFRVSEAIGLRWQDVDLAARRVSVRRRRYKGRVDSPKSRHGRRDVPIPASLAEALGGLWRNRREGGEALVFPVDAATVYRSVKSAARRAGVPWASPHTLRHTAASLLFARGENAKRIQRFLGHHRASFTLDTYVHLLDDELPEAIDLGETAKHSAATLSRKAV